MQELQRNLVQQLRHQAQKLGFDQLGVSPIQPLPQEAAYLKRWLAEGKHGTMRYMADQLELRLNPALLLPGAKTVISVSHNYNPGPGRKLPPLPGKVSRYAWGADYHTVLRKRLFALLDWLRSGLGDIQGRVAVDSAPMLDKVWARRAGLGWIGKHTNLIHPRRGSWFFIGHLIVDVALEPDTTPVGDFCGSCTRCIDACPTQALKPYEIDARKCISYLTIELKSQIEEPLRSQMEGWMYGCDICQEVCPWNRFSEPHQEPEYEPLAIWEMLAPEKLKNLSPRQFQRRVQRSAISRVKLEKWIDNAMAAGVIHTLRDDSTLA